MQRSIVAPVLAMLAACGGLPAPREARVSTRAPEPWAVVTIPRLAAGAEERTIEVDDDGASMVMGSFRFRVGPEGRVRASCAQR